MILNDAQIRLLSERPGGMIQPYNADHQNGESYDLTLGPTIKIQRISWLKALKDLLRTGHVLPTSTCFEEIDISETTQESPYYLRPNEPLLACSEEFLIMPAHLVAKGYLKSSRAREFLEHLQAVFVDATFQGRLTFEFVNLAKCSHPIWYGKRVLQLTFEETSPALEPYCKKGHYQGDLAVQESKGYFK